MIQQISAKRLVGSLEALSVDDGWSRLIVLFLGDPHLLEGGKRRQDRSSDPDRVFSLRRGNNLDLDGWRSQSSQLLVQSLGNTSVHGSSTRENNVVVQLLSDVDIALHDGVIGQSVDTSLFHTDQRRLEQHFWRSESLISDGDNLSIGKFIRLLNIRGLSSRCHFGFKVQSNISQLLLDISDDFSFGSGSEGISSLRQDLHEVISQVSSCQVQSENGVRKGISFINWDSVGHSITRVQHNSSGSSGSIQRQHCLNGDIHCWGVEGLEHNLSHLLSVCLGVQRSLSEQYRMLFRGNSELVVEGVVPNLLHIIPVGDDSVLNGVLESQDTSLGLSLVSNVSILLGCSDHHSLVSGSSDD